MNLSVISFATDYYPFQGTDKFSFCRLGDHIQVVLLKRRSSYKEVNLNFFSSLGDLKRNGER